MSTIDNSEFWQQEGRDAALRGERKERCPYLRGTAGAAHWMRGWADAGGVAQTVEGGAAEGPARTCADWGREHTRIREMVSTPAALCEAISDTADRLAILIALIPTSVGQAAEPATEAVLVDLQEVTGRARAACRI